MARSTHSSSRGVGNATTPRLAEPEGCRRERVNHGDGKGVGVVEPFGQSGARSTTGDALSGVVSRQSSVVSCVAKRSIQFRRIKAGILWPSFLRRRVGASVDGWGG